MEKAEGGAEGRAFGEGERLLVHLTSADVSGLVDGVGGFHRATGENPDLFTGRRRLPKPNPQMYVCPAFFSLNKFCFRKKTG